MIIRVIIKIIDIMKEKIIKTDKVTLLVVECPKTYSLFNDDEWGLIGRLPDITEEQADKVVNKIDDNDESYGFERFMSEKDFYRSDFVEACKTRLESLYSLLQANEVYFENPLGEEAKIYPSDRYEDGLERTWKSQLDFQEAQSKVWDKERTYLLKMI